jgi:D-amino-acid dehydrogenase
MLGADVVVVGGGLVGTALAFELADAGARTLLVDAHHAGRATDAGAGILSPETAVTDHAGWFALAMDAAGHYRRLVPVLEDDGGTATGYAVTGTIRVALREWEDEPYAAALALARQRCPDAVEQITPEEARARFPPLGEVRAAWYSPRAARIDGRAMTASLLDAARARGVDCIAGTVDRLVTHGERVTGVVAAGEATDCGAVVIAGGAWTPALAAQLGARVAVAPVRGQIAHLRLPGADTAGWPMVQPLLSLYVVPWPDGHVAVGATHEPDAGFDARVTASGARLLFSEMLRLAPGLADASFMELRSGLRPVSTDDLPVFGAVPGWDNAFVCTGHGANGLLLGPYSAHLVARLIRGEAPKQELTAFLPDRFA